MVDRRHQRPSGVGFLLGALAYTVPLAAVGFLPGVKQWCHNLF